jgi:hypothetical protein
MFICTVDWLKPTGFASIRRWAVSMLIEHINPEKRSPP